MKFRDLKKRSIGIVFIMLMLIVVGCSDGKIIGENKNPLVTGEGSPNLTPQLVIPVLTPDGTNPLNIEGYQWLNTSIDTVGNVNLLSRIAQDAKIKDEFIFALDILSYDEEYILIQYITSASRLDYMEGKNCQQHLVMFASDTKEVVKQIDLDGDFYIYKREHIFFFEEYHDTGWTIKSYDYQLNEIGVFEVPGTEGRYCTADGKRCYYSLDGNIYVLDTDCDTAKEVEWNGNFSLQYLSGVLTDDAGTDYLVLMAMAGDYKDYQLILDVTTKEIVYASNMDSRFSMLNNNTYMEYILGERYPVQWLLGISKDKALDYRWDGVDAEVQIAVLKNRDMLFYYILNDRLYLFLYDYYSGTMLGSTSFAISLMQSEDSFAAGMNSGEMLVYFYDTPIYTKEGKLLLNVCNYADEQFLVEWNIAMDENASENLKVADHMMGSVPSVDLSQIDQPLYTPGELSDALMPLRERADDMEEKYSIEIYLGEECANMLGGYAIQALTDYKMTEDALDMLETQIEKYPDNFFGQFSYDWIQGLDIYLAGRLKGMSGEVLDYAGGFKTVYDSRVLLVLDCTDIGGMVSTFHHELCHVIEEKIVNHANKQSTPLFTESKWNALNPYDNMYTYTYAEYGFLDYEQYSYTTRHFGDGKVEEAYFVDNYAMTYPTEDRARLFESVMSDVLFDVDFSKAEHLKEKLNYFAECIRDCFDTNGWENVPWEAYSSS